jgi:hypothetical protein
MLCVPDLVPAVTRLVVTSITFCNCSALQGWHGIIYHTVYGLMIYATLLLQLLTTAYIQTAALTLSVTP